MALHQDAILRLKSNKGHRQLLNVSIQRDDSYSQSGRRNPARGNCSTSQSFWGGRKKSAAVESLARAEYHAGSIDTPWYRGDPLGVYPKHRLSNIVVHQWRLILTFCTVWGVVEAMGRRLGAIADGVWRTYKQGWTSKIVVVTSCSQMKGRPNKSPEYIRYLRYWVRCMLVHTLLLNKFEI